MSSSDDDEDLKRAIALSLQDSTTGGTARDAISLDSDSKTENEPDKITDCTETVEHSLSSRAGLGLLGLDRKQMEQERLSRKRKLSSISPPPVRKAVAKAHPMVLPSSLNTEGAMTQDAAVSQASSGSSSKGPGFLAGTVKKTWAFGHDRVGDDIKLEEVLQKDDLNLGVLSSFQWDIDWLLAKINTGMTKITLVMQAKDQAIQQQYRRETAAMSNLRLCFPSMEGQINCMHSKLMLLSHPNHLRVAVPTANLVSYDWGETGIVGLLSPFNSPPTGLGAEDYSQQHISFSYLHLFSPKADFDVYTDGKYGLYHRPAPFVARSTYCSRRHDIVWHRADLLLGSHGP